MPQHDYDIANQAGAAFRADLNAALLAIASNNSGATPPATTFAYQFWADTNAGLLRQRNAANTAWVTIGALGAANFGHILPGTVAFHAKSAAPSGWLKANGGAVSRATYADLFAEIGTVYGSGDGSTTFNVPDLRGEFLRGWDDSRGVDSGRTFGSSQADLFKTHSHSIGTAPDATVSSGAGNGGTLHNNANVLQFIGDDYVSFFQLYAKNTGGTETRPRNIALLACIKF